MATSPEPNPPKVFISYAWKNQPIAKQLQRDLQRDGVEVFVDYEKITGGDSLPDRISAALDWCNTLVLMWSADSSQSYYVSQEWESAFHLQKRIIPCVLDGTALPAVLRRLLYLDFSKYETGYAQLCRSIGVEPKSVTTVAPSSEQKRTLPPSPPIPEKPTPKPKRKQTLVHEAMVVKLGGSSGSASKISTQTWWRRGTVMNITFAVIIVAIVVMFYKMCQQSQLDSMKQVKKDVGEPAIISGPKLRLRSTGIMLPIDSMEVMLRKFDFYHANYANWIMTVGWSNPQGKGIDNQLELSQDQKVIFDRTTGLIWQKFGSSELTTYPGAERYVRELNNQRFANYGDWRLPTLEEAMSLMEPQKINRLYIDLNFDRTQIKIWTADKQSASRAWVVYFNDGVCFYDDFVEYRVEYKNAKYYVRAVRSGQ